jgi:hypothetical protein
LIGKRYKEGEKEYGETDANFKRYNGFHAVASFTVQR